MIKGIIFDLDGTTLYTLIDLRNALNYSLKHFNLPERSLDEVRLGVGTGFRNLIKYSVPSKTDEQTKIEIGDLYLKTYSENYDIETRPYSNIPTLLKILQNKGIKLAINSNKSNLNTNKLINKHFPDINFIAVFGAREGVKNKPDPESANEIIKLMDLNKDEVLYVGDSETDIQTGKNASVKTVGCLWGYRDLNTLKKINADYIIKDPLDLLNYLD